MANGTLMAGTVGHAGSQSVIWTKVSKVKLDGSNYGQGNFTNGDGPVTLTDKVPSTAIITEIIPAYATSLSGSVESLVISERGSLVNRFKNLGTSASSIFLQN